MKKRILIALVVLLALAATASLVWANTDGLVSYWPFDDGTASDVVDANHGTIVGATLSTDKPPVIGNVYALAFDGNDHVHVPNSSNLNITTGSWGLWLKFDSKPSVAGHLMNPLAKANQYWVHASTGLGGDHAVVDAIQAKITVGGTRYVATTDPSFIQTGIWYHVVGTYDGGTLKLYVDGLEVDSNGVPSGNLDITSSEFAIGTWSYHVDYFHGLIDEVGIWNRALTAEEVAALSGSVEWLPPLALEEWTLNENATLPIKLQLKAMDGSFICTDVGPTLMVGTQTLTVRFDESGCYYIANFKPGTAQTGLTATVSVAGVQVGVSRQFDVLQAGTPNGRGRSN